MNGGRVRPNIVSAVGALSMLVACGGSDPATSGADTDDSAASTTESVMSSSGVPVLGDPLSLVDSRKWELTLPEEDPFVDERPTWIECELGWDLENGIFEVDTEVCLYGSFVQTTQYPIAEGDEVELVLIHDPLHADEPASAHVALAFGDEIAWETEIAIPSEANQLRPIWIATHDVQVGSPVSFHLHNHGTNHYRLISLTVSNYQ